MIHTLPKVGTRITNGFFHMRSGWTLYGGVIERIAVIDLAEGLPIQVYEKDGDGPTPFDSELFDSDIRVAVDGGIPRHYTAEDFGQLEYPQFSVSASSKQSYYHFEASAVWLPGQEEEVLEKLKRWLFAQVRAYRAQLDVVDRAVEAIPLPVRLSVCPACKGRGSIRVDGSYGQPEQEQCENCNGSGKVGPDGGKL